MNLIEDLLESFPSSKLGVIAVDREGRRRDWHFGELIARSAGLSGAFAARGVRRGDVVLMLVGNRIEWVLAMLACWRMGAVALPCNTQLRRHDLEHRVEAASPALAVGEQGLLAELPEGVARMTLEEIADALDEDRPQETPADAVEMGPEDPALIVFTSGTTGGPRGVVHAYRYLYGNRAQAEHWFGSRKGEIAWCTTATGWSKSARNVFLAPWLTGASAVIHDGRFDPAERLDLVEGLGVDVLCQAPTEYRMLAKRVELRPLPALRRMVSAGEPLNPEVIAAFREATGLEIADGYGQTETGQVTGNLAGEPVRPGSMGRPLPGFETRVLDGELQLRVSSCPTFFSRYLDGSGFEGEWWATGDLVGADEDGYLYLRGARRRHHPLLRLPDRALRGRVRPALAPAPSPRRRPSPRPTPTAARWSAPWSCCVTGSARRRWPASCRSTASARRPPTSSRESSSSSTNCPRRRAERSSAPSSGRGGTLEPPHGRFKGPASPWRGGVSS